MKKLLTIAVAGALATAAGAQVVERVYSPGSVYRMIYLDVAPGEYNAWAKFMKDTVIPGYRMQQETGDLVSWKILDFVETSPDNVDVVLVLEYKNFAVFDRPPEFFEQMNRRRGETPEQSRARGAQARALATVVTTQSAQEMIIR